MASETPGEIFDLTGAEVQTPNQDEKNSTQDIQNENANNNSIEQIGHEVANALLGDEDEQLQGQSLEQENLKDGNNTSIDSQMIQDGQANLQEGEKEINSTEDKNEELSISQDAKEQQDSNTRTEESSGDNLKLSSRRDSQRQAEDVSQKSNIESSRSNPEEKKEFYKASSRSSTSCGENSADSTRETAHEEGTPYNSEEEDTNQEDAETNRSEQNDINHEEEQTLQYNEMPQVEGMTVNDNIPSMTSREVSNLPPLETDPEDEAWLKRALEAFNTKGILPEPKQRVTLIQYVQRLKVNAVVQRKFKEAGGYQETIQKLTAAISESNAKNEHSKKMETLEDKLAETKQKIAAQAKEADEHLKDEKKQLEERKNQLVSEQNAELDQFEDKWNDTEYLRRFAKPSMNLIQMQNIEHSLLIAKEFARAEEYRLMIAEAEKKESDEAQMRAEKEMKRQQAVLLEKQQKELDAFDEYAERSIQLVIKSDAEKMAALEARKKTIEKEIEMVKNTKTPQLPPLFNIKTSETPMTPRTLQRYSMFKSTTKKPKVSVKPLGPIAANMKKSLRAKQH